MNVDIGTGRAIPFLGTHIWYFRCSITFGEVGDGLGLDLGCADLPLEDGAHLQVRLLTRSQEFLLITGRNKEKNRLLCKH